MLFGIRKEESFIWYTNIPRYKQKSTKIVQFLNWPRPPFWTIPNFLQKRYIAGTHGKYLENLNKISVAVLSITALI